MNLQNMLEKCRRLQWQVGDLDWTGTPRPMSRDDEIAVVQYFTDMAGIERLAGALFEAQRKKTDDPVLAAIFESFVKDELRHAHAAQMLADYYDVHRYRQYRQSAALSRFAPHFIEVVEHSPPEIANAFITGGELLLDVALLRSLNDYVADDMMRRAMELINRDESRHVAIDFYMVQYYASDEYMARRARRPFRPGKALKGAVAMSRMMYHSRPFFRAVFFDPMKRIDPSGKRIQEAMKRFQLLGAKPDVARQPLSKLLRAGQRVAGTPVLGWIFSHVFSRAFLVEPELYRRLTTDQEEARAAVTSIEQLAEEALALKHPAA